jgi:hypothetical protein
LALLVAPIRVERMFLQQPAAVVFITDPARNSEMPIELFKRLYGLTPREPLWPRYYCKEWICKSPAARN